MRLFHNLRAWCFQLASVRCPYLWATRLTGLDVVLVDTGKVPNLHNIYMEFYHSDVYCLPKNDLKVALRLLSYTEVLKKADSDTYFY